jgi:hypothetical protein
MDNDQQFATKEEVHGIRARLELIERSLRREVGPLLDVVETAAGVVASAIGGPVGKVANVVKAVAEKVESVVCKGHNDGVFCGLEGCEFKPNP